MLALNSVERISVFNTVLAAFGDWVRKRKLIRQCCLQLEQCDSNEIAAIAKDVGVSPRDLRHMARLGPDAANLLIRRMAVLHLDANALARREPTMMRDMQRLRSSCASKRQCQFDLLLVADDSTWRHYCPNAGTLDALQSEAANVH